MPTLRSVYREERLSRRLLAEIAAALVVATLVVTLAWWWNRPTRPEIKPLQCAAPVEIVAVNGSALWCGDDQLHSLLQRLGQGNCEAAIRDAARGKTPLRLTLEADCAISQQLSSLSPTVLTSLGEPLDMNSATAEDLTVLEGIGPKLAAAIVADRAANGPYCSLDDVARVKGIGPARIEGLKRSEAIAECPPRSPQSPGQVP